MAASHEEAIEQLRELLAQKQTELEMTAEYGLELSNENAQLEAKVQELQGQNQRLRAVVGELENRVSDLTVQMQASQSSLRQSSEGVDRLEAQMNRQRALQAEQAEQQQLTKIQRLQDDLADYQERLHTQEEEAREREAWLEGQATRLKEKVQELEEELRKQTDEELALRADLEQCQHLLSTKSGELSSIKTSMQAALEDKDELKKHISELMEQMDEMSKHQAVLAEDDDVGHREHFELPESPRDDPPAPQAEDKFDDLGAIESELDGDAWHESEEDEKARKLKELNANLARAADYVDAAEVSAFVDFINSRFQNDQDVHSLVPTSRDLAGLFKACADGMVLCKLVNLAFPNTIDERVINKQGSETDAVENFRLCIDSCRAAGVPLPPNITIGNVLNATACDVLLCIVWALIKACLEQRMTLAECPELSRLGGEGGVEHMSTEGLCVKWVNYHTAGTARPLASLQDNLTDCTVHAAVLGKVCANFDTAFLDTPEGLERAQQLVAAAKAALPSHVLFLSASSVMENNPRLNLAFFLTLFSVNHGIVALSNKEKEEVKEQAVPEYPELKRDAEVCTAWLNSLGLDPPVTSVFTDLNDGLFLLKVLDKLNPGAVDWRGVATSTPIPKFMRLQNTNHVVKLCRVMRFSIVGIAGEDIDEGKPKVILSLVWQMMRYSINLMLHSLSISGQGITDSELIKWANEKAVAGQGNSAQIKSFGDAVLKDSTFFLNIMDALRPGVVNRQLVATDGSKESLQCNARYAISIARKLGASIFVSASDIYFARPKLMFTFVAALLATTRSNQPSGPSSSQSAPPPTPRTVGRFGMVGGKQGGVVIKRLDLSKAMAAPGVVPAASGRAKAQPQVQAQSEEKWKVAVGALERKIKELEQEKQSLSQFNGQLCAEVGKLRAQLIGQFHSAAKSQRQGQGR